MTPWKNSCYSALMGCGCVKKCSDQFPPPSYIWDMRAQYYDVSVTMSWTWFYLTNSSDKVVKCRARQRQYTTFHHASKIVCGTTFRFLHTGGSKRLTHQAKSIRDNRLSLHIHGNTNQSTHCHLSRPSMWCISLSNAEQNALLPGRVPGYSHSDIKLLPSSVSKRVIWKTYKRKPIYTLNTLHTPLFAVFGGRFFHQSSSVIKPHEQHSDSSCCKFF